MCLISECDRDNGLAVACMNAPAVLNLIIIANRYKFVASYQQGGFMVLKREVQSPMARLSRLQLRGLPPQLTRPEYKMGAEYVE
jgi:hypothetical protein